MDQQQKYSLYDTVTTWGLKLFQGRVNRINFILGIIITIFPGIFFILCSNFTPDTSEEFLVLRQLAVLTFIPGFVLIYTLCLRRVNDIGKGNSVNALLLGSQLAPLFLPFLLFIPGEKVPNKNGAVPNSGFHLSSVFGGK